MERKLASIQRIDSLLPIEGADFVVAARVLGWTCVVRKDWFQPRDLCVFFEIDSVLPPNPVWDDIVGKYSHRIRSQKFRGVISQGFAIPLSMIGGDCNPETCIGRPGHLCQPDLLEVDDDLTTMLGIQKWEPQESNGSGGKNVHRVRTFPSFIPKTEEIRAQSCPSLLEELFGKPYYISVKMDGTSFTAYSDEEALHVCSRNNEVKDDDNDYWNVARKYNLEEILGDNPYIAIQGEMCGPGFQKNRLGLREPDLYIFNIYNIRNGTYYNFDEFCKFCHDNRLQTVPIEETGEEFRYSLEDLLVKADGTYKNTNNNREGIVIRSRENVYSSILKGRTSFKVISNRYLLKNDM